MIIFYKIVLFTLITCIPNVICKLMPGPLDPYGFLRSYVGSEISGSQMPRFPSETIEAPCKDECNKVCEIKTRLCRCILDLRCIRSVFG